MQNFNQNLKKLRIEGHFLQKDLAEMLNITIRQYQRYEKGEQEPNIKKLIQLADCFDVSLDFLLGRTEV